MKCCQDISLSAQWQGNLVLFSSPNFELTRNSLWFYLHCRRYGSVSISILTQNVVAQAVDVSPKLIREQKGYIAWVRASFQQNSTFPSSPSFVSQTLHCAIQINCSSICYNRQVFPTCLSCEILEMDRYSFLLMGLSYSFYYFPSSFKESFNTSIVSYVIEMS